MSLSIAAADIVTQLRRRFGIRGSTDISLDEQVTPVANVGDLEGPPWNSKNGYISGLKQAAVAGQLPYFVCGYGSPSGAVLVTRELSIIASVTSTVRIAVVGYTYAQSQLGGLAGNAWGNSWDTPENFQFPAAPALTDGLFKSGPQLLSSTSAADFLATLNGVYDVACPAGTGVRVALPFAIRRGFALVVRGDTVNVAMTLSIYGDEYPVE